MPDPRQVLDELARVLRPGGMFLFDTINRNPIARLATITMAEDVLKLLPKGTHEYDKFIRPSEMEAWARAAGLALEDLTGMSYNPLTREYRLGSDVSVNYLACFRRS